MITFWTIANCDRHCYRCSSNTPPFLNWSHSLQWLLCRLPALAEATYRDHFCRLASSCVVVGVTKNFCHIFLWNHRGQLPDIWHRASVWRTVSCNAVLNLRHVHFLFYGTFNIVDTGHRQICSQVNFCHIFFGNHRDQLPDIWHRASVWRTVSCIAVLNLRHVHFLFDATLNILKKRSRQATHVFPGRLTTKWFHS